MIELDSYDRRILSLLETNSRISNTRLAELVNLSPSACLRRTQALKESGVITSYTVLLDERLIGADVHVLISITLNSQDAQSLADFEQSIVEIPNVVACYLTSGSHDYFLRLVVKSIADYEQLYKTQLSTLPHVQRLESNFAMRTVIRRSNYLPS